MLVLIYSLTGADLRIFPGGATEALAAPNPLNILCVKPGGVPSGACNTWVDACDLQYALATATAGTEIWIAKRLYTPGVSITSTFQMKKGVELYGGFAMTETERSQRDWEANLTVLSGDIDGNDTTDANGVVMDAFNIHGTNAYHVVVASATDAATVLDGLTVTAGYASGDNVNQNTYRGGGMYSEQDFLQVRNVTFSGNRAGYRGGAIASNTPALALVNCILWGNSAAMNPQIFNYGGNPTTITYSDIQGGYTGAGNLNADPKFISPVAASVAPTSEGDYRLQITSPAIDAGINSAVTTATDLDGKPHIDPRDCHRSRLDVHRE